MLYSSRMVTVQVYTAQASRATCNSVALTVGWWWFPLCQSATPVWVKTPVLWTMACFAAHQWPVSIPLIWWQMRGQWPSCEIIRRSVTNVMTVTGQSGSHPNDRGNQSERFKWAINQIQSGDTTSGNYLHESTRKDTSLSRSICIPNALWAQDN